MPETRQQAKKASTSASATRRPRLPGLRSLPLVRRSRIDPGVDLVPEAALHATFNFRMGVLNGVMFTLVEALIAPSLVLAWFVSRLGGPNILVGLLPAILAGGWFLPQLLVASRVQGLPRVMFWYRRVGVLRTICMAMLGFSALVFSAS